MSHCFNVVAVADVDNGDWSYLNLYWRPLSTGAADMSIACSIYQTQLRSGKRAQIWIFLLANWGIRPQRAICMQTCAEIWARKIMTIFLFLPTSYAFCELSKHAQNWACKKILLLLLALNGCDAPDQCCCMRNNDHDQVPPREREREPINYIESGSKCAKISPERILCEALCCCLAPSHSSSKQDDDDD